MAFCFRYPGIVTKVSPYPGIVSIEKSHRNLGYEYGYGSLTELTGIPGDRYGSVTELAEFSGAGMEVLQNSQNFRVGKRMLDP